jgi:hypothetical protein
MRRLLVFAALLIAYALLAVAPAARAVVPVSAERLVVAVVENEEDESASSASFGLFDEAV